jgi:hypothetical protein
MKRLTYDADHQLIPDRIDANHKRVIHDVDVCQEFAVAFKRPAEDPL